jgi:elongation factor G
MLTARLGARPLVMQRPLGAEPVFRGVIDLVSMQALVWTDGAMTPQLEPIPAALSTEAKAARLALVEQVVEFDDDALRRYLADGDGFEAPERQRLVRLATIAGAGQTVLCGSAWRNVGVQPLLDAIVAYSPSPEDRPAIEDIDPRTGAKETRSASADAPTVALVSKVQMSRYGTLSFVRLYAGRIARGDVLVNAATGARERIGRLLRMHADNETEVDAATAGDVVAVLGLKANGTGETLSDPTHPLVLPGLLCPEPVIEAVIEPRATSDRERLGQALATMAREDPSLRINVDADIGATLVSGMGELHLMIVVETLKEDHDVEVTIGAPRVAYLEALARRAEIDQHRKQSGGPGQYARVRLALEPLGENVSGLVFEDRTAARISGDRAEGDAARWRNAREGFDADGVRIGHARRVQGGIRRRPAAVARTGNGGPGDNAGRASRRDHRRFAKPAWLSHGVEHASERAGGVSPCATRKHVQLCECGAIIVAGAPPSPCSSAIMRRCRRPCRRRS